MFACVFSGQGSQYPGMGRQLYACSPAARAVYDEAADRLGCDWLALDELQLARTEFAQPAIVIMSLAAWQAFRAGQAAGEAGAAAMAPAFAGFSLGEYSALGAAGVLSLSDLLRLVRERARLMQEAAEKNPGAMLAVLGLEKERILAVLDRPEFQGQVFAANDNAPGQLVISGSAPAVGACSEALKTAGARRLVPLKVGGAFHTPLMAGAAAELSRFAAGLNFRNPAGPFYGNPTGNRLPAAPDWPEYLARQMVRPVLWVDEVRQLAQDGCSLFCEFGPGKVLTGLIRKILPESSVWPVEDEAGLSAALLAAGPQVTA